jgi:hypothetical protein
VGPSPFRDDANFSEETQEQQMNQPAISLIDVLMPPGNRWLMELSRRKADLPPGVRIVRFSENDDASEVDESEGGAAAEAKRRKKIAA